MSGGIPFLAFLRARLEKGGFTTEDALGSLLPLFRQVANAHDAGLVAPLEGVEVLSVDGLTVGYDDGARARPKTNESAVEAVQRPKARAFEVLGTSRRSYDLDAGSGEQIDGQVGVGDEKPAEPRYIPGYRSWEHLLGHHDPLSDQMVLGLVLASLACGFDFERKDDLEEFVRNRRNLFLITPHLNPVLAQVIVRMTELDRHRRARDVHEIVRLLETYRDQPVDFDVDMSRVDAAKPAVGSGRRRVLLERLQERLFEISRRNRLLYFKPSQKLLNLTIGSVPALFDVQGIRPEQLMTWNAPVEEAFASGKAIPLGHYLRFEDAPYLPGVLDAILAEARRDEAEFGFSQLRVVICFLRWHNLKEAKEERIDSPLLLLKVKLVKKKGVRDSYTLQAIEPVAEVNPVLRYHLRTLYGIELPEAIELTPGAVDAFHELLLREVRKTEPAVTIEKISKPHVEIIHERAQRRLDQYRRRQRPIRRREARSMHDLAYSYRGAVDPLGLKLFQKLVFPSPAPMREIVDSNPILRNFLVAPGDPGVTERERTLVSFHESTSGNPYSWDFDLCNLTLGNFKYRRMSLVRDYETLIEEGRVGRPFDAIFSLAPRPETPPPSIVPIEEEHTVVECDPTQASAIAYGRKGDSYIIQGPPGTGKSQTITNLIADYVAAGKRVLFVCEKRAALDVVYHRLRQKKLDSLCSLIHDSQSDKKEFIADLRTTYEGLLQEQALESARVAERRRTLIDLIRIDRSALAAIDDRMRALEPAPIPFRALLARAVELHRHDPALGAREAERVPSYDEWLANVPTLRKLDALLGNLGTGPVFGTHPLRRLSPAIASQARPYEAVQTVIDRVGRLLDDVLSTLAVVSLEGDDWDTLANVLTLARFAERVEPLARLGTYGVLEPSNALAGSLRTIAAERRSLDERLAGIRSANRGWRDPLGPEDTAIALAEANALEGSIVSFLKPAYWRLRRALQARYDFRSHPVRPRFSHVLQKLQEQHDLVASLAALEKRGAAELRWDGALADLEAFVEEVRTRIDNGPSALAAFHAHCLTSTRARNTVGKLVTALHVIESVQQELGDFFVGAEERRLGELASEVREVTASLSLLNEVLPVLQEMAELPDSLASAIRGFPLTLGAIESASARRSIQHAFSRDAALARFSQAVRERHLERLRQNHRELQRENVHEMVAAVSERFRKHVAMSGAPAGSLSCADGAFKKRYASGRRELEHEFGKTMRYRSIRELFSAPAGDVMLDLKPVWLMSPLSVSDTLPLDTAHFDVVIFDEASQIPLEEAIPSLFRAEQIIVVGDQMQLPPTSFFSAKTESEEEVLVEDDGDTMALSLDSDSFLNHAAKNLPSTMLGWHYRSRSEALISFSNAAFYQGRLLTVPDRTGRRPLQRPISAQRAESGFENVQRLVDRSISFHLTGAGIYEDRRNTTEAFYIAHMVRGILLRGTGESIGIIAFSEAQQGEIERALGVVASEDPEFAARLEVESTREEDDQFVGLLVKNLENIQGNERDIVILSVCYGKNRDGRMLMNFGPINQSGGEKRLNVAFSRAKKHMAVVSSIRHPEITNTYNDGANALRRYLKYAEAISIGDDVTARSVLRESGLPEVVGAAQAGADVVVRDVAEALRAEGYEVELGVGQSHFRCDLAVRKPGEPLHRAAILVDTDAFYRHEHAFERDLLRPAILESFDWRVLWVLTKDWYENRALALTRLISGIEREEEAPPRSESAPAGAHASSATGDAGSPAWEEQSDAIESASPAPAKVPAGRTTTTTLEPDVRPQEPVASLSVPMPVEPAVIEPPVTAARSSDAVLEGTSRRFEFVGDGSKKFWEIRVDGATHVVTFGRIGAAGQSKTKSFSDSAGATSDAAKLIGEKLRKGYQEVR